MDRDIAMQLVDVMTDIKTAVQTIANGGTPPEATTNVSDSREVTEEEPSDPEEPVTRKSSKKGGTNV